YGVGDLVTEMPQRIGYQDSLRVMCAADGLLLLGSDDRGYSPSKLYPYYLSRRPLLALAHEGSLLQRLVEHLRCAQLVTLLRLGQETQPATDVARILRASASGQAAELHSPRADAWFDQSLSAAALARRQCQFFDVACRGPHSDAPTAT
ncbi:MAG TPA: hypothetical protein VK477_13080, partial [Acidobacteriota bacterium]|nr:hypothetical protein [Acidobacteriota bacterium]